jgi:hypothetical protein
VRVVSDGFGSSPTFGELPDELRARVVGGLALDLPLELVGSVGARPPPLTFRIEQRERCVCVCVCVCVGGSCRTCVR